jgi:O-antigen ligase
MKRITVLRAWLGTFVLLSAVGVVQHFTGWPRPQAIPGVPGRFHATLFLGHHLSVASVFIFPFFVLLDFLRQTPSSKAAALAPSRADRIAVFPRWFLLIGAVLGFMTLGLTYSRTLWVALPIGIALWALLSAPRKLRVPVVIAIILAAASATQVPWVKSRLSAQMGIHTREDLWEANLKMFESRPLTGVGLKHNQELSGYYLMEKYHSSNVFSGHAHNNVLDFLGGTGLIGLLAWIVWWVFIFRWTICPGVRVVGYDLSLGLLCALVVFQLNGLTQVNFWEAKVQHQLMWAVAWLLLGATAGAKIFVPRVAERSTSG